MSGKALVQVRLDLPLYERLTRRIDRKHGQSKFIREAIAEKLEREAADPPQSEAAE